MADTQKKILIAEDEPSLAMALQKKLTGAGFDVKIAVNGQEAIEMLQQEHFALMFLDLIMPKVDGFQVLEFMREKKISTPVIVLSNLGQDDDIAHARELGAKDFLIKSDTKLATIVEKVLEFFKS